ncbi:MAG: sigma-70 family RNA polymerase sigma factor [Phycisphaerales bacterium]|nr:MAG: sigma-70 family RNA polymerase sigma factor [Phycisphaerales bacterium]
MICKTSTILLLAIRDPGNAAGWEQFDHRYRPVLVMTARRLGLSQEDAEDAAQETLAAFAAGHRAGRYDRAKGRLRNWLLGIARHKIQDVHRSRGKREMLEADRRETSGFLDKISDEQVDTTYETEWRRALLRECLNEVRHHVEHKTLEAFELFGLKQWPVSAVAARLGMSEESVYQSKSRVLKHICRLREELEESW